METENGYPRKAERHKLHELDTRCACCGNQASHRRTIDIDPHGVLTIAVCDPCDFLSAREIVTAAHPELAH